MLIPLATPTGFEPATPRLGIWCSIHLSYGAIFVIEKLSVPTPLTSLSSALVPASTSSMALGRIGRRRQHSGEEWEQTVKLVQDRKDASALCCRLAAPHCSARP